MSRLVKSLVAVVLLALSACADTPRIIHNTETVVITPPANLYQCPEVDWITEGDAYMQSDVSILLKRLFESRENCRLSLENIREYAAEAERIRARPPISE